MRINKIARPINRAKNEFVKWLKNNDGYNIDIYYGDYYYNKEEWNYYCCVSGFVNDVLYTIYFTIWNGTQKIECYENEIKKYDNLSIQELSVMFDLNCV